MARGGVVSLWTLITNESGNNTQLIIAAVYEGQCEEDEEEERPKTNERPKSGPENHLV